MNPAALHAARFFLPEKEINRLEPYGTGNVNDTFLITRRRGGERLVLQRVNPAVFKDPELVQRNMRMVTGHMERLVDETPVPGDRFVPLVLHMGKKGDSYLDTDGAVWRLVNHIPGRNLETVSNAIQAEELGRCLGFFHRLLSSLEPSELADTLPGFHHTPSYLARYDRVRVERMQNPGLDEERCHSFIDAHRGLAAKLIDAPELGRGIIHGDPKVANFIFAAESERVVSLIDLDTVRPGLFLHDIGDALRSCCNPRGEVPASPVDVRFDMDLFAAWLNGYRKEAGLLLTGGDKEHIVEAVRVIAFELGLRFLTDHLEGNRYFRVDFPGHNLMRARVQLQLVQSVEEQQAELESIARDCLSQ